MEQDAAGEAVAVRPQPLPLGLLQPDGLQGRVQHLGQEGLRGGGGHLRVPLREGGEGPRFPPDGNAVLSV